MSPVRHQSESFSWLEAGAGRPLLFLHPVVATAEFWLPQLAAFAASRRCLALDAPGYDGRTAVTPGPEGLADRLVAFLDEVGEDRADMVGLSLGGMHAMYAMIHAPERVGRAVLADTSPAFGLDPQAWLDEWLAPIEMGVTPGELAGASIDMIVHAPVPAARRAPVVEAAAGITETGFRASSGTIAAHDVRGHLGTIAHDVLVVVGEHDGATPPEYSRAIADALPNGRLEVIAGAGHLSSLEQPDAFNELVEAFLAN